MKCNITRKTLATTLAALCFAGGLAHRAASSAPQKPYHESGTAAGGTLARAASALGGAKTLQRESAVIEPSAAKPPTGGAQSLVLIELSKAEAARIPIGVVAQPLNQKLRATPAPSRVPGGTLYGYTSLGTVPGGERLQAAYIALRTLLENTYESQQDFATSGYTAAVDLSSLDLPTPNEDAALFQFLLDAVTKDNPQFYFLGNGWFWVGDGTRMTTLSLRVSAEYQSAKTRQALHGIIEAKYQEYLALTNTVTNDVDKIRLVHDKMLAERDYAYFQGKADTNVYAHNILGVMDLSTNGPVCDAYSKATSYILHRLGMEAITVSGLGLGGGHAWNAVKAAGQWYWLDATWDDLGKTHENPGNLINGISYRYFLVGNNNTDFNVGYNSSAKHWPAKSTAQTGNPSISYELPTISSTDYTQKSSYRFLTDNGYFGNLNTATPFDDWTYCIGKSNILTLKNGVIGDRTGNPLFYQVNEAGSVAYNTGAYQFQREADLALYSWTYNQSGASVSLKFTNPVALVKNVDYAVTLEPGKPGDLVRAWLIGKGPTYRGIDFVWVRLDGGEGTTSSTSTSTTSPTSTSTSTTSPTSASPTSASTTTTKSSTSTSTTSKSNEELFSIENNADRGWTLPSEQGVEAISLWGKPTKWSDTPLNRFLLIVCFGWIWMAF